MKTNQSMKWLVKIRGAIVCFSLATLMGIAFWSGTALSSHLGPMLSPAAALSPIPSVSLPDLMAVAR